MVNKLIEKLFLRMDNFLMRMGSQVGSKKKPLCFSRLNGEGTIRCKKCGYEEEIVCFTHGDYSCEIGRQCPNCHAFTVEYNESDSYCSFGDSNKDFICKECGAIIRKKDEDILKDDDNPLYCPKCHCPKLRYYKEFVT